MKYRKLVKIRTPFWTTKNESRRARKDRIVNDLKDYGLLPRHRHDSMARISAILESI